MTSDWFKLTLGDVCEKITDGAHKSPKSVDDGKPMASVKDLTRFGVDLSNARKISKEDFDDLVQQGCKPHVGDVLIAKDGNSALDTVCTVDSEIDAVLLSSVAILRPDPEMLDSNFLKYYFCSPQVIDYLKTNFISGVAIPRVVLRDFRKAEINLPPLSIQRKISQCLSSIDNKIFSNTQTNQTLEQMAQAIFKSWFVDFDPVKAKMNGEQPEGMDAVTASLFPEKLDSETGIPVGWSQGIIEDIAKLNAKSWTKKNQPEQVHYVDLANTKNGVIETVTTYDFDEAPSRARRVLNSGDTIVGTVRPGNRSFAFIGETEQPLTGSTGFAVLSPKEEFWTSFVYLATTNDDAIDEYARLADGGAYPAIKPVVVADTPCVIPTTDIAQKFWQLTGAMLKKAHQNRLENEELAKLRDTLLPKLLSGDIELETK
ncbi:restriction endonuclease subunit S [Vibrio metschnikovii]|uniref:restriction endonuclease subunit S n=1 Tax=Vibrio metschnikovii TaxID=28172 RepID=UPI001C303037|nr:restriction endonuclease subunit S [Vibrio metschnikovii]